MCASAFRNAIYRSLAGCQHYPQDLTTVIYALSLRQCNDRTEASPRFRAKLKQLCHHSNNQVQLFKNGRKVKLKLRGSYFFYLLIYHRILHFDLTVLHVQYYIDRSNRAHDCGQFLVHYVDHGDLWPLGHTIVYLSLQGTYYIGNLQIWNQSQVSPLHADRTVPLSNCFSFCLILSYLIYLLTSTKITISTFYCDVTSACGCQVSKRTCLSL